MLDHHIQRQIVTRLKSADALSFTDLKPDELDNKLFTYHLKATVREQFVEKTPDGYYRLTPAGQKLWKRMSEGPQVVSLRAFSVLYIAVHHAKHGWLLYRRHNHPLKNKIGFMHALPNSDKTAMERAEEELLAKTGLHGTCTVIGSGFFRTVNDTSLESFVNFTMLLCEDAEGELEAHDTDAEYFWSRTLSIVEPDILPNMPALIEAMSTGMYPFYIDKLVSSS
jgi:ADP-ribose pyrophosphatase YjhB (NUDIX family)